MTARLTDINGYTTIPRNPISKVGVFPYSGRSIGAPPDQADRIFMVYRPESELSDPEALDSFKLTPWTDDHAMLGDPAMQEGLVNPEDKGIHGTIGEQVEYDPGTRTMYANLRLWSTKLGQLIDAGKKELSCGFRCVYEFAQGNFEGQPYDAIQRHIRGNHFASVAAGRMGPGVAVLDHLTFTFDAKEFAPMATKTTRRIATAKKMGVKPEDLATVLGMDAKDPKFIAAMDAEVDAEEGDGGSDPTLGDIAAMLESVGPALAGINSAIAAIAGGGAAAGAGEDPEDPGSVDDMEPMVDAAGKPMMDPATGKPKMQKKAAPAAGAAVADAVPPALAAMDASLASLKKTSAAMHALVPKGKATPAGLVAMDAAISGAEAALAKARKPKTITRAAMDALETRLAAAEAALANGTGSAGFKAFAANLAKRDTLYNKASAVLGAFDHAEMDTVAVAKYAADKLGLSVTDGQEVTAVEMYLAGRLVNPAPATLSAGFAVDAALKPDSKVLDFLNSGAAAA